MQPLLNIRKGLITRRPEIRAGAPAEASALILAALYQRPVVIPPDGSAPFIAAGGGVHSASRRVACKVMPGSPSRFATFIAELRRRRVFRVAAVHGGVAFVIIQIIDGTCEGMFSPVCE